MAIVMEKAMGTDKSNSVIAFISQLPLHEQEAWMTQLSEQVPNEKIILAEHLTQQQKLQVSIAIVANPAPQYVLELTHLIWCQSLWAGVDSLVTAFTSPPKKDGEDNDINGLDFKISRLIDPRLAQTMSEAVLTWTLYLHREMHHYKCQQYQSLWRQIDYTLASDRTVGILGLGELGQTSALRLKNNGFNVLGWSRSDKQIEGIDCFSGKQGLKKLAQKSDIVICLLPLTKYTRHIINTEFLNALPMQACVINFARGGIINNDDLFRCLQTEQLAHVVLDVFDSEPLDKSNSFWQHKKVTVLPHISAPTDMLTASEIVARNIKNFRSTGKLPICIDLSKGY